MIKIVKRASIINIVANVFLLVIKLVVGILFSSISILSDAVNSFSDIVAAIFIYFTVRINDLEADNKHQFGHSRAENIAGYTTGVLMLVLSIAIIKMSVDKIISGSIVEYNFLLMVVVGITFFVKGGLYFYIRGIIKTHNSPALKANMQDHLNDVLIIFGVFIAIVGVRFGYYLLDPIMGILIAIYIFKSGFEICRENVHFLMGVSADDKFSEKVKKIALKNEDVLGVNDIFTQYLGNKIQVEVHIELDESFDLKTAHDVGNMVKENILKLGDVIYCFVHIDVKK